MQENMSNIVQNNSNNIVQNNSNNITNSNNINSNNVEIKILNYGKENLLEILTKDEYIKILEKTFESIPEMIKKVHFNPQKPSNQNIFDSNARDGLVSVFKNNK